MQIKFSSVLVDDQAKALRFYTKKLGFKKMADLPFGEHRWLTVVSPEGMDGVELVLEPLGFKPARAWQRALFEAGCGNLLNLVQPLVGPPARKVRKRR